jgi:hypothetical protein
MKKPLFKRLSKSFWRKDPVAKQVDESFKLSRLREESNKTGSEQRQPTQDSAERERDWLFVGNDEEGTPIYLDRKRIVRSSGSTPAQVWLKHVPSENARSLDQARKYLKETGADWKSLCYIEQLLELDANRNLIADLVLSFFDWNDKLIEQVQFRERALRPLGTEAVYSAIKEIVAGHDTQPEPQSSVEQPNIDERIQLKMREINSALEAFDKS